MADAGTAAHEGRGLEQPSSSVLAEEARTEQPERELKAGDPNMTGTAASPGAKKGMVDKVKDLFEGVKKGRTGSAEHSPAVSNPQVSAADNQDVPAHVLDPTAAPAGHNSPQQGAKSPGPWPHPTNPRHGHAQGEAISDAEHGVHHPSPTPLDGGAKKEGFLAKIKDKLHSPKSPKSNQ